MACTHSYVDTSHKQRIFSLYFMILEELSNKVHLKKNIYIYICKLEADKIACQNLGAWDRDRRKGRMGRREKGRVGEGLSELNC